MVAKIVLDEITSSGSGITIDSAKTFTVNGSLLTTGATQITSTALTVVSVDNTGSPTVNISGKSASIISVNASSNSSVVTLPPVANFTTCSISIVSPVTHGAGYKIEIKDNGGTELYTLYHKGDYCEFVSDGTNVIRTGNEFTTIYCNVALTADVVPAAGAYKDVWDSATSSNYSVVDNYGSGWNSTTSDFIVPFAGLYRFGGHIANHNGGYVTGWMLKKNGVTLNLMTTGNLSYTVFNMNEFPVKLAKDDSIEFWITNHSGVLAARGNATSSNERCVASAWIVRRY
jgi:hypothetical protein